MPKPKLKPTVEEVARGILMGVGGLVGRAIEHGVKAVFDSATGDMQAFVKEADRRLDVMREAINRYDRRDDDDHRDD